MTWLAIVKIIDCIEDVLIPDLKERACPPGTDIGFDVEKCFAGTEGLVSGLAQADRDEYWSAPLRVASRSTPPSRAR